MDHETSRCLTKKCQKLNHCQACGDLPQKQTHIKATNNELKHNDYQLPQRMWHSCTSGKKPCAHLKIQV
jgi:hypothetical protein